MKSSRLLILPVILLLLGACSRVEGTGTPSGSSNLPTPVVGITRAPSAEAVLQNFLNAFVAEDYPTMYTMIAEANRAAISEEDFIDLYQESLDDMSVETLEYILNTTQINPTSAQAAYRLVYHTALFGEIANDHTINVVMENGTWHVQWDEGLILPEMSGGRRIITNYQIPPRGNIYDRNGNVIVEETEAVALALVPQEIIDEQEGTLMFILSQLTGMRPDTIRAIYQSYYYDPYVPIGETTTSEFYTYSGTLADFIGWRGTEYTARYYHDGGIASQTVGYLRYISEDDWKLYKRQGYAGGELIGYDGIEKWGEELLHGQNSATLLLLDEEGRVINPPLASAAQEPASDIHLTIDSDLQRKAEAAMDGMAGAIVVLEADSGRVLAMVSTPGFDPNVFIPENLNSGAAVNILGDTNQPLFNRASQGAYPLGSVFKIITMAAALESGAFTAESTYDCQYKFTDLVPVGGQTMYDWTWDHCQAEIAAGEDCTTMPSGMLTLPQGLMRSCNPWFWHIGLELYNAGMGTNISTMARSFGLGSRTGIEIDESTGNIPDPGDGQQATNIAIGQGDVQVTPLQAAVFTAALRNGGTLYQPQLVEKIVSGDGEVSSEFTPVVNGTLPVSEENLQLITDAMHEVTTNRRGTAWLRLNSLPYAVSGKTGTAESGIPGYPHSWFVGFTSENRPDKPDIAIAVFVEYKGEGSDYAAPIFRRIVEIYFSGNPQARYWFEESIGVTETPTPGP